MQRLGAALGGTELEPSRKADAAPVFHAFIAQPNRLSSLFFNCLQKVDLEAKPCAESPSRDSPLSVCGVRVSSIQGQHPGYCYGSPSDGSAWGKGHELPTGSYTVIGEAEWESSRRSERTLLSRRNSRDGRPFRVAEYARDFDPPAIR